MNKSRRSRIDEIIQKIEDLVYDIDVLRDEEEESYENLPESIQYSDRGEAMSEAIDNLESAISSLEEATEYLNEAKGE